MSSKQTRLKRKPASTSNHPSDVTNSTSDERTKLSNELETKMMAKKKTFLKIKNKHFKTNQADISH